MRIGVAIALYNGIQFIKEQIDSLLAQTLPPDIIVCCDDGSSDGTMDWLRRYVQEKECEDRLLLVQNEERLGYIQNFYKALDLCDADILFLCDQDDIWDQMKVERMSSIFTEDKCIDLLACAHTLIDASGSPVSSMRYAQKTGNGTITFVHPHDVVARFNWPGMTMAMRRSFWNDIKETAMDIRAPHDRVLALLASCRSAMAYMDLPLCAHRLHSSNSGGEENSAHAYLGRKFKVNELATSLDWLNAQLEHKETFSAEAQNALSGYSRYISLRLNAVKNRNLLPLFKALICKGFVNPKGIAADIVSIIMNK